MLGTGTTIGDIDGVTGPAFAAVVRDVVDRSDETLLSVDCSGVTFMDPVGYHVLVEATRYAARHRARAGDPQHATGVREADSVVPRGTVSFASSAHRCARRVSPVPSPSRRIRTPIPTTEEMETRVFTAFAVPDGPTLKQGPKRR